MARTAKKKDIPKKQRRIKLNQPALKNLPKHGLLEKSLPIISAFSAIVTTSAIFIIYINANLRDGGTENIVDTQTNRTEQYIPEDEPAPQVEEPAQPRQNYEPNAAPRPATTNEEVTTQPEPTPANSDAGEAPRPTEDSLSPEESQTPENNTTTEESEPQINCIELLDFLNSKYWTTVNAAYEWLEESSEEWARNKAETTGHGEGYVEAYKIQYKREHQYEVDGLIIREYYDATGRALVAGCNDFVDNYSW